MLFWKQKPKNPTSLTPEKELLKKVRRIHIKSRRAVNDVTAGEYQSAFKGRGMEFDTVREYQEGDEERTIDWNVTARFGHPYVKSFVEERELTVVFLVDISASGRFGSSQQLKNEIAAEFCAVLALNAVKKNDKIGLVLFSDQIELFVPPQKGRMHVLRVIRELLYFKPQHKKTSINTALEFFNKVSKRSTVAFLVSDYLDDDYFKNLNLTSKKHDLVAVEITDPRESNLSGFGLIELEDPETGDHLLIDSSSRNWQKHHASTRTEFDKNKKEQFHKLGIDHLQIRTDRPFEKDLITFFKKRSLRR
jgi:uncharacterized protein (DUF58 family)